jgi:hypothetical protein
LRLPVDVHDGGALGAGRNEVGRRDAARNEALAVGEDPLRFGCLPRCHWSA